MFVVGVAHFAWYHNYKYTFNWQVWMNFEKCSGAQPIYYSQIFDFHIIASQYRYTKYPGYLANCRWNFTVSHSICQSFAAWCEGQYASTWILNRFKINGVHFFRFIFMSHITHFFMTWDAFRCVSRSSSLAQTKIGLWIVGTRHSALRCQLSGRQMCHGMSNDCRR